MCQYLEFWSKNKKTYISEGDSFPTIYFGAGPTKNLNEKLTIFMFLYLVRGFLWTEPYSLFLKG